MPRARKERAPSRANSRRPSGRPGSLSQPSGSIGSSGRGLAGLGRWAMAVGSLGGQPGWPALKLLYPKEMDRTAPLRPTPLGRPHG